VITFEAVHFLSGGQQCAGYLLLPATLASEASRRENPTVLPAVILCAGFGGTQDTPSIRAAADAFVEAGFATLTFDYRSFGESEGIPRQVPNLREQLRDIRSAIRFLRSDPRIDASRITLWGTSLGGAHAVVAAAHDRRIAAVVAQVPFTGFPRTVTGRSTRATLRLLTAIVYDRVRGALTLSPAHIPAVGPSGSLAVMASTHATEAIDNLESATWRNSVAPRVLIDMMPYRPSDHAKNVAVPLLVCIATRDAESPPEVAHQIVTAAPRGRAIEYPMHHFEVYRPDVRERVLADQTAFLREVL
jgi:pimeloyl-ACP methyl ester carboxylesterase